MSRLHRLELGARGQVIERLAALLADRDDLSFAMLFGSFLDADAFRDVDLALRLLLAIEASLALCYHVSARRLKRVPEDYAGCFTGLADGGLISPDLSARLQQMARFRNLLVHVYWHVDYNRVFDVLENDRSRGPAEAGRYDQPCPAEPRISRCPRATRRATR